MSYTKQTWQTGDTITAAKLNHMEDGIAAGGGGADLIIKDIDGVWTASGLSFSGLFSKCSSEDIVDAKILKYVDTQNEGHSVQTALRIGAGVSGGVNFVSFAFEPSLFDSIFEDGTADISRDPYSWTYDGTTKTYTLTPNEDGGK